MIWLFLILALSTVAVSLVGFAAYLRVRSHIKGGAPGRPTARIGPRIFVRPVARLYPIRRKSNMAKPASLALDRGSRALLLGGAGGDRDWRQPVCRPVRPGNRASAVPSCASDSAEFWRAAGRLTLGSRRGFAALALYLVEGASGMPVFIRLVGGVVQILGATGGFLMAYPLVAGLAGWMMERGKEVSRVPPSLGRRRRLCCSGVASRGSLRSHTLCPGCAIRTLLLCVR